MVTVAIQKNTAKATCALTAATHEVTNSSNVKIIHRYFTVGVRAWPGVFTNFTLNKVQSVYKVNGLLRVLRVSVSNFNVTLSLLAVALNLVNINVSHNSESKQMSPFPQGE